MTSELSYKEFIDAVESRLEKYTVGKLRELIISWAKDVLPSERREFLGKLPDTFEERNIEPDPELMSDIDEFYRRVKDNQYVDGWGWDEEIREERLWGDESWTWEMDGFLSEARITLRAGDHETARKTYGKLFDIFYLGEAEQCLPGSDCPSDMIKTDISEVRACYLRAIYGSAPPEERPPALLKVLKEFDVYYYGKVGLEDMRNAELEPLPEFDEFLPVWIDLLKEAPNSKLTRYLLREAVVLAEGTSGIAELARKEGDEHPKTYIDWIKALEEQKDHATVVEAAKEGLDRIDKDHVIRAEIARALVRAGECLDDTDMQITGWREAAWSDPSLYNILKLLRSLEGSDEYRDEEEKILERILALIEKKDERGRGYRLYPGELKKRPSSASKTLLIQIYLCTGKYEEAFDLCQDEGPLGWNYGNNLKGYLVPFFLKLMFDEDRSEEGPNLEVVWNGSVNRVGKRTFGKDPAREIFRETVLDVRDTIAMSDDEEKRYLEWCIEETGARIEAIVGNLHRGSYDKAATLLVATAEVLASRGLRSRGSDLIERYRRKFPRHSAFKKELNKAMERGGMFG